MVFDWGAICLKYEKFVSKYISDYLNKPILTETDISKMEKIALQMEEYKWL